jgi:hypothetical protein
MDSPPSRPSSPLVSYEIFLIDDLLYLILAALDSHADLARTEGVSRAFNENAKRAWLDLLTRDYGGARLSGTASSGTMEGLVGVSTKERYKARRMEQLSNLRDLEDSMVARIPETIGPRTTNFDNDIGEIYVPLIANPWQATLIPPVSTSVVGFTVSDPPTSLGSDTGIRHGIHRSILACRNHKLQYRVAKRYILWQLRQIIEVENQFAAQNLFSGRLKRVLSCEPTEHPLVFAVESSYRRFFVFSETGEPMDDAEEGVFALEYAVLFDLQRRAAPPLLKPAFEKLGYENLLFRLLSKERTLLAAFPHAISESLYRPSQNESYKIARRYVFANSFIPDPQQLVDPTAEIPEMDLAPFLEPQHLVGRVQPAVSGSHEISYVFGGIGQSRLIVITETGAVIRSRIGLQGRVWRALLRRSTPRTDGEQGGENVLDAFRQQRLPYFALVENESYELPEDVGREQELLSLLLWECFRF